MSEPTESAFTCLVCGYNLTGLPENRCPECGTPFVRDELLRVAAAQPDPILPGVHLARWPYVRRVWWLSLTSPRQFARGFPPRHDAGYATSYTAGCYFLAAMLFAASTGVLSVVAPEQEVWYMIPPIAVGSILACWLCETVTAAGLALLLKPVGAPDRYHFWRGLTHYTSGCTLLSGLCGGVLLRFGWSAFWGTGSSAPLMILLIPVAVFFWWVIVLSAMVVERSKPSLRQWLACCLIPVVGVGAILAGICLSWLCGFACFAGG